MEDNLFTSPKLIFWLSLISPFPFIHGTRRLLFLTNMKYCNSLTKLISTCQNCRLALSIITPLGTASRLALFSLAQLTTYKRPIIIIKSHPKTKLAARDPQLTCRCRLPLTFQPRIFDIHFLTSRPRHYKITRFKIYTRFSKTEQQIDKFYILIFEFLYVVLRLNSRITRLKP